MAHKLSAPVGATKRISEGNPVKNTKRDVTLVQQMLTDNGMPQNLTGKCDAKLIKTIQAFQRSRLKYKKPDGIVDPGLETFKKLYAKFATEQKRRDAIKYAVLKVKGKTIVITEKEFDVIKTKTIKKLLPIAAKYKEQFQFLAEIDQEYMDIAMFKKGFMEAITNALIVAYKDVDLVKAKYWTEAERAISEMNRALKSGNFDIIQKTMVNAEQKVNAYTEEMVKFLKKYASSASDVGTILTVTGGIGFAIVGVLAAPALVTGAGLTTVQATLVASGGVAVLESMSKEIATQSIGKNKSILASMRDIAIDGTVSVATAGIGNKLKLSFVDDVAKALAPQMTRKLAGLVSEKAIKKFLQTYLTTTGKAVIKDAVGQTLKLLGKSAKTGKPLKEKDFILAVQSIVFTALSAGVIKDLQTSNAKWSLASRDLIAKKLGPDAIAKVTKDKKMGRIVQAKVIKNINNKLGGKITKLGFDKAIETAKGSAKPDSIVSAAEKAILADRNIAAQIAKIVQDCVDEEMVNQN